MAFLLLHNYTDFIIQRYFVNTQKLPKVYLNCYIDVYIKIYRIVFN